MKKNSCTPINPKKYSCYDLKKIPAARKFPSPPITFLTVRPWKTDKRTVKTSQKLSLRASLPPCPSPFCVCHAGYKNSIQYKCCVLWFSLPESSSDFLELLWLYALSWHGCGFQFVRRGGPSKEKQAGTRNISLLYLAGIFLNPSTLFPVLALFFTRESCLTPEIQAHNRKTSLQKLAAMTEKG